MHNDGFPKIPMFLCSLHTYDYLTLCYTVDFEDIIKLRILRFGNYPGLVDRPSVIIKIL